MFAQQNNISEKDTVWYFPAIDPPSFVEKQLNKLSKSTWIIVVNGLRISKAFHNWTKDNII